MDYIAGFLSGATFRNFAVPAHTREWGRSDAWVSAYRAGAMAAVVGGSVLVVAVVSSLFN